MELLTERLLLRPLSTEDALDFYRLNNDPEVLRYVPDLPFKVGSIARPIL